MGYTVASTLAPDTGEIKVSDVIVLEKGESASYAAVYGAGNTQLVSFQKNNGASWVTIASATMASSGDNFSGIYTNDTPGQTQVRFQSKQTATSTDESVTTTIVSFEGIQVSLDVAHVYETTSVSLQVTGSKASYDAAQVDVAALTNIGFHKYGDVNNVAATSFTVSKAELHQGTTGSITGFGYAGDFVVHINNSGTADGTLSPLHLAFESAGTTSDPVGADAINYITVENQGNATGGADIDTDVNLFQIIGHTISNGNLVMAAATSPDLAHLTHGIRIKIGSTLYYIPISTTAPSGW
jgi:hypothetical protein